MESHPPSEHSQRDHTQRHLKSRHVQMIGTGGSISTMLFVQLGFVLPKGGPGSLLLSFVLWITVMLSVNNSLSEMVSFMPISSPFIRFAYHFVDPALGFASAISFIGTTTIAYVFDITALDVILHFWTDKIPFIVVFFLAIGTYLMFNLFAVQYFGEAELWLALGKVILAIGLIIFTFVVMVGGNPDHDAFGFRNWDSSKIPGTPFAEYIEHGNIGRFMGFLACLSQASMICAGPEYLAMTAGEVENPRQVVPRSFKQGYFRLIIFYVLGALCIGILVPYSDLALRSNIDNPQPGAAASPYVLAMQNLRIGALPHVVNVLVLLSAYSAGNGYMYSASRVLFGIGLETDCKWLCKCTKRGVPIYHCRLLWFISVVAIFKWRSSSTAVARERHDYHYLFYLRHHVTLIHSVLQGFGRSRYHTQIITIHGPTSTILCLLRTIFHDRYDRYQCLLRLHGREIVHWVGFCMPPRCYTLLCFRLLEVLVFHKAGDLGNNRLLRRRKKGSRYI